MNFDQQTFQTCCSENVDIDGTDRYGDWFYLVLKKPT